MASISAIQHIHVRRWTIQKGYHLDKGLWLYCDRYTCQAAVPHEAVAGFTPCQPAHEG